MTIDNGLPPANPKIKRKRTQHGLRRPLRRPTPTPEQVAAVLGFYAPKGPKKGGG